jgi:hypothetical protein
LLNYFQIAGRFPQRRRDIPQAAVSFVARQLQVCPSSVVAAVSDVSTVNWQTCG